MTFSKSKIMMFWAGLLVALVVAIAGAVVSAGDTRQGEAISMVALALVGLDMVMGAFFLRCPSCGKVLLLYMKPWKDGCACPRCGTKIK